MRMNMSGYPPPTIANVDLNTNQVEVMGCYPEKNKLGGQALNDVADACRCLSTNPIFGEPCLPAAITLVGGGNNGPKVVSSSVDYNHQQLPSPPIALKPSGGNDRGI